MWALSIPVRPTGPPLTTTSLIPESADRPGDDPIFTLHADAVRRAAAGEDILNATIGALMDDDGRMSVMPAVFEAYQRVDPRLASAYAPISGPPEFLEAVIGNLYGETALAEQSIAVATTGGTGAIHHSIVNFLEPGQELLTTSFYWGPYGTIANHTRRGVRTFRMFAKDGSFDTTAYREELFALMESQGRALVVINTPCHNPTGYSLRDDDWEGLVEATLAAAERGPVAFLLDYAYAMFAPPEIPAWQRHAETLSKHLPFLVAWSASKSFAQYGSRVGALAATCFDEEERTRIKHALGYSCRGTWSNCNHLGMLAITELFRDDRLREAAIEQRARLTALVEERVEIFNRLAREVGLVFPRYEGGFFVSIFTPDPEAMAARMREDGVFVIPLQGAVRVALCATPAKDLPRLVDSLARAVQAVEGSPA